MTSCGGTSKATVRRLTRTMRSMGRNTRITPGPFGRGRSFPRRKMTPRSYSDRILTELIRYSRAMTTKIRTGDIGIGITGPHSYGLSRSSFTDCHSQAVNVRDLKTVAFGDGFASDCPPDLAVRRHSPGRSWLDGGQRVSGLTDHARDAGDRLAPLGSDGEPYEKDGDAGQREYEWQDESQAQLELGHRRIHQDHR